MRKLALAFGTVLLLFCAVGAYAQDEYCLYTKVSLDPLTVFVNGKESFDLTAQVRSICGWPVHEGQVCFFDAFKSLTFIKCVEVNEWGKAYITIRKGQYVNFSGPIPTQYIQARFFDEEDLVLPDGLQEFYFPSISNPGTLVCVGCASGF